MTSTTNMKNTNDGVEKIVPDSNTQQKQVITLQERCSNLRTEWCEKAASYWALFLTLLQSSLFWLQNDWVAGLRPPSEFFNSQPKKVTLPAIFSEWPDKMKKNVVHFLSNYLLLLSFFIFAGIHASDDCISLTLTIATTLFLALVLHEVDKRRGPLIIQQKEIKFIHQMITLGVFCVPFLVYFGMLKVIGWAFLYTACLVFIHASLHTEFEGRKDGESVKHPAKEEDSQSGQK